MITTLRHLFVDSWAGRAAAFLIFLAFVGWGVGDIFSNHGFQSPGTIAQVGDHDISADAFARALGAQLPDAARHLGFPDATHIPSMVQQQIAQQVLQGLAIEEAMQIVAVRSGLTVPDHLVRDEIFKFPAFLDASGRFDRATMNKRLSDNRLTEKRFIQLVREDLAERFLFAGIGDSVQPPSILTNLLIAFQTDIRSLSVLRVPFAGHEPSTQPTDAQLRRYYDNHPQQFQTPEYRHIKAVVMTPQSVADTIEVPDDVLRKLYTMQERSYNLPETRSLEVLTFRDRAKADAALLAWQKGMDWPVVLKAYPDAIPATPEKVRQTDLPDTDLAHAAFTAPPRALQGPVRTAFGWVVFRVTDVLPPHHTSFEQARDTLRKTVREQQAPEAVQARTQRLQDAVAGSADLDKIPTDLGAVPIAGSLNASGMTQEGIPAPIPGGRSVREAVIRQAFSQARGAPPRVLTGPENSAYALVVDDVRPGTVEPFESVRGAVQVAWRVEQSRHAADERATALFVQAKKSTLDAAVKDQPEAASLWQNVRVSRAKPDPRLPDVVLRNLSSLKPHETGMYQGEDAFWLVTVGEDRSAPKEERTVLKEAVEGQYRASLQADISDAMRASLQEHLPMKGLNIPLFDQVLASVSGRSHP